MLEANIYPSGMTAVLDRSLISVTGPDAPKYLQSMLTNDVERIVPGGGIYALLLTPKARIIADLEVFGVGEGSYVLGAPVEARDAGRVERFVLFTGHRSVGNLRLYRGAGYVDTHVVAVTDTLSLVHLQKTPVRA